MDAHNFRVTIRCVRCGEVCPKWEGDELPDADDNLGPVCPACFQAATRSNAMAIGTPTCPDCSGKGRSFVHVNRGSQPHTWEEQPCRTCNGHGLISRDHAERIEEGNRRREDRKARNLSLREEAKRLGITPVALSDIENGRKPSEPHA